MAASVGIAVSRTRERREVRLGRSQATRREGDGVPAPEGDSLEAAAGPRAVRVSRTLTIPERELRFRFAPSGGPGGQHANKVSTRVELRFDVAKSPSLGPVQRARLLDRLGPEVRIVVDSERSQSRNRAEAIERFRQRLAGALRIPRSRTPTRPSRASVERRLQQKRRRSQQKQSRRTSHDE
ncbi:MAG: aminoacyl-tRNA hydrolase [Acidimicrobiales bacterium]|nr:aminoacyl-tRNA hydrolase [Acidimicrobiales bacterium]